ncbi:CABYR protein, partial [Bucorvus abyssinicus]|nr:CABYR protein [Bucorvus abyssinicus]
SEIRLIVPRGLKVLLEGVSRAVVEENPDDIAEYFALYFQELVTFRKENGSEGLEEETSEFRDDTIFSGEPEQRDKCTDTEEDQLLQEPDIQYSSKETQYPSIASSIAESQSPPGFDGASSPEGPDLAYVPAEPAQLAAHMLGNSDSFYSVRDVATSVQTLHEDSQISETEFLTVEGDAEDDSAVSAAETSVGSVRSQPGVWSQSSITGELWLSDSQADVSTNYVNQASAIPLWEEPSPSPAPKGPLQAVPSCSTAEITSATESWHDEAMMDVEVP